jgi:hypothetical protein
MAPYNQVMHKWKEGELHSGSKKGPAVKSQKQAVAIMLSEKKAAAKGKAEYKGEAHSYDSNRPANKVRSRYSK